MRTGVYLTPRFSCSLRLSALWVSENCICRKPDRVLTLFTCPLLLVWSGVAVEVGIKATDSRRRQYLGEASGNSSKRWLHYGHSDGGWRCTYLCAAEPGGQGRPQGS